MVYRDSDIDGESGIGTNQSYYHRASSQRRRNNQGFSFFSVVASSLEIAMFFCRCPGTTLSADSELSLWDNPLFRSIGSTSFITVFLTGQPRAGKTSFLYRLKLHDFIPTTPTTSPVTETFKLRFTCITHSHFRGGLPALECTSDLAGFESCQLIWKKVKIIDAGRSIKVNSFSESTDQLPLRQISTEQVKHRSVSFSPSSSTSTSSPIARTPPYPTFISRRSSSVFPPWTSSLLTNAGAVIVVLDSGASTDSILECREDIIALLFDDAITLRKGRVAILANKQDVRGCLTAEKISELLELPISLKYKRWKIFPTSAKSGEGISDALSWLFFCSSTPMSKGKNFGRFSESAFETDDSSTQSSLSRPIACQFRLIPNDMSSDRFNFEEREARRLRGEPLTDISSTEKQKVRTETGVSMVLLESNEQPSSVISPRLPPPSVIGKRCTATSCKDSDTDSNSDHLQTNLKQSHLVPSFESLASNFW